MITDEKRIAYQLYKQNLLPQPKERFLSDIVNSIGGLHSSHHTTPYISLFARTKQCNLSELGNFLFESKKVLKIRCIRNTIYFQPIEKVPAYFAATRKQVLKDKHKLLDFFKISEQEMSFYSEQIISILEDNDMTAIDMNKVLSLGNKLSPILTILCDEGKLIRGKQRSSWRDRVHYYGLLESHFPELCNIDINTITAQDTVIQDYVFNFGPVYERDISWWTGFKIGRIREWVASKKSALEVIDNGNKPLIMIKEQKEHVQNISPLPQEHIVFLPSLDGFIMGYKNREHFLDDKYYDYLFDRSGNSVPLILIGGRIAGVWDFQSKPEKLIGFHTFIEQPPNIKQAILKRAKSLGRFFFEDECDVKECWDIIPIRQLPAGRMVSPLKECLKSN